MNVTSWSESPGSGPIRTNRIFFNQSLTIWKSWTIWPVVLQLQQMGHYTPFKHWNCLTQCCKNQPRSSMHGWSWAVFVVSILKTFCLICRRFIFLNPVQTFFTTNSQWSKQQSILQGHCRKPLMECCDAGCIFLMESSTTVKHLTCFGLSVNCIAVLCWKKNTD